ncbi:MAG: hypothetical protein ACM31C_01730, partial [Acidobacteriota bacterium]
MLAQADSRPVLVAACALLAANVALVVTRPELPALPAIASIEPQAGSPLRRAFTIEPPALRDAQPWPRGLVIVPPETGDRIAIFVPGADLVSALLAPLLDLVRP